MHCISCLSFHLDDDYLEKNIPPEAEELSFEVSYSEMVTETPDRNKWKKSDIKKEDYVLTVSNPSVVSPVTSREGFCADVRTVFLFSMCEGTGEARHQHCVSPGICL